MPTFTDNVSGIGLLSDPLRREIYLYVCSQPTAVGRDETADALDIAHHKAKFHLDKLEEQGLLESEFARLTGRTGPGAGRPAKLYRRAPQEISVSLPGREYELAGKLMADAIAASAASGESVIDALLRVAAEHGRAWGRAAMESGPRREALDIASEALAEHGYEPRSVGPSVELANCPFHSLASEHTEMVCGMNLALIDGLVDEVDSTGLRCSLEPADGRCCVVLHPA
ncbi:transcriptional regulator [Aeromicrobium panaciterrae]|uniref:helix-turn-helix transcriptional regulator n=1 Tax=Aeromicrobium panaciterrae TaxID=363861 RepID=UPI0031E3EB0B